MAKRKRNDASTCYLHHTPPCSCVFLSRPIHLIICKEGLCFTPIIKEPTNVVLSCYQHAKSKKQKQKQITIKVTPCHLGTIANCWYYSSSHDRIHDTLLYLSASSPKYLYCRTRVEASQAQGLHNSNFQRVPSPIADKRIPMHATHRHFNLEGGGSAFGVASSKIIVLRCRKRFAEYGIINGGRTEDNTSYICGPDTPELRSRQIMIFTFSRSRDPKGPRLRRRWTSSPKPTTRVLTPAPLMILTLVLLITRSPQSCLLYTSPSPRDGLLSRMPSSA